MERIEAMPVKAAEKKRLARELRMRFAQAPEQGAAGDKEGPADGVQSSLTGGS
jgi:hypothetical protein